MQYIVTDGVNHSDSKSIATALNAYFASVGKYLAAKFTTVSQTFTASPTPVPETMFQLEEAYIATTQMSMILKKILMKIYLS